MNDPIRVPVQTAMVDLACHSRQEEREREREREKDRQGKEQERGKLRFVKGAMGFFNSPTLLLKEIVMEFINVCKYF